MGMPDGCKASKEAEQSSVKSTGKQSTGDEVANVDKEPKDTLGKAPPPKGPGRKKGAERKKEKASWQDAR